MTPEQQSAILAAVARRKEAKREGDRVAMAERVALAKSGQSSLSPEAVSRAAEADQTALDRMLLDTSKPGAGTVAKMAQGLPFVGEWVDEGLNALDPGRGDRLRDLQDAMERQHPAASLASEIGGGILGALPFGAAAAKATLPKSLAGKIGVGVAGGGLAGLTEGAIAGAGRANDGDRLRGAFEGGLVGMGLGGALGGLAPVVGAGVEATSKRVKKLDVRTIAETLGVSPKAARVIKSAVEGDDLVAAERAISHLGDDAMLADAGPATGQLLDAVQQSGGDALRISRDAVEARASGVNAKLTATLDRLLGAPDGMGKAAREISQRTAAAREAAYNRAYRTPIDYSTGAKGERVLEVIEAVPSRYLVAARQKMDDMARLARLDGKPYPQAFMISETGEIVGMPTVLELDYLKRALDEVAERDQFGRLTQAGRVPAAFSKKVKDATTEAVSAYGEALALGGDKIAEDRALEMGGRLLTKRTTFEEASDLLRGVSEDAKAAAKRGMREHIENTLSNVRRTITDPNADAREAMALVKELSSRANMKKARLVLGADAGALFDELERAEAVLALRAATSRNSATAARLAVQGQIKDETQPNIARRIAGNMGNPLDAAKEGTRAFAGIDPASISREQRKVLAEISRTLVSTKGEDARRAVEVIRKALSGQPLKNDQAEMLNRLVTGHLATGGYQTGMQFLEPR